MRIKNLKIKAVFFFAGTVVFFIFLLLPFAFAQENLEKTCGISNMDIQCQQLPPQNCQDLLNKCLKFYEERKGAYEKEISTTQRKSKTIMGEIKSLEDKINKLKNEIAHNKIVIKDLNLQIKDTEKSIVSTGGQIESLQEKIAEILRLIDENDKKSIVTILFEEESLSGFFDSLTSLEALGYKNQELLQEIRSLKIKLEGQKTSLDKEKDSFEKAVLISSLKAKESANVKKEKDYLLEKTKGDEKKYQQYLKETEEKAREIRKRIFELAHIPGSEAPSYEEAYLLAKNAGDLTGVRPALILGLLQVESAIGKNVGQCNCKGRTNCRYPNVTYKDVMPKSHWDAFAQVTSELGLDINSTPISCSVDGGKVQWGGAMGPAQFMPNTWLKLGYKEKIEKITGVKPANPWRVRDAFLAAALYLSDWDAKTQKLSNEIGAVTAYLCGTSYMTNTCKKAGGETYRSQVMRKTNQWQQWIDQGVFNK